MKNSLYHFALKDIKITKDNSAPMGAFILESCLIDCLAGFRYGMTGSKRENSDNYIKFVDDYFDGKYKGKRLYEHLRCKLVHNYSEGGSYYFSNDNELEHNKIYDGKTNIKLEDFLIDLEKAMNKYFSELENSLELQKIAKKRMDDFSIIEEHLIQGSLVNANSYGGTVSGSTYFEETSKIEKKNLE
jgi:hypothetical protein